MNLSDRILWTKSKRLCQMPLHYLYFYKLISLVIHISVLGTSPPHILNAFYGCVAQTRAPQFQIIMHKTKVFCSTIQGAPFSLLLKAKMPFVAGGDACRINPSSPTIDYYSCVTLEKAWSTGSNLTLKFRTKPFWAINYNSTLGCTSCWNTLPKVFHSRIHSTQGGREEFRSAYNLTSTP